MLNRINRKLNSLEVLLLVLMKEGLTSPYELMSRAGMSAGLTSPALRRLESAGCVIRNPGPRNASRYTITGDGEMQLRTALEYSRVHDWLPETGSLFESGPRSILTAWLFAGKDEALGCVDRATSELRTRSRRKVREAEDLLETMGQLRNRVAATKSADDRGILVAMSYRWLKATMDADLLEMQANVMAKIDMLVVKLPLEIQAPLKIRIS
jgi:DNA-binding MarR family transcriptional regulator